MTLWRALSPSEQSQVPSLLNDDQSACSFTDDSIYNLSTMDVPGGAYGNDLGQMVSVVTLWATSDALAAIEEIQALDTTPSDKGARQNLAKDDGVLRHDRTRAADRYDLDKLLGRGCPVGTGPAGRHRRLRRRASRSASPQAQALRRPVRGP